jgi:hypothetical protein
MLEAENTLWKWKQILGAVWRDSVCKLKSSHRIIVFSQWKDQVLFQASNWPLTFFSL